MNQVRAASEPNAVFSISVTLHIETTNHAAWWVNNNKWTETIVKLEALLKPCFRTARNKSMQEIRQPIPAKARVVHHNPAIAGKKTSQSSPGSNLKSPILENPGVVQKQNELIFPFIVWFLQTPFEEQSVPGGRTWHMVVVCGQLWKRLLWTVKAYLCAVSKPFSLDVPIMWL